MEELTDKLERTKCFVAELLNDLGHSELFNENHIEEQFFKNHLFISNSYKLALYIFDNLISSSWKNCRIG